MVNKRAFTRCQVKILIFLKNLIEVAFGYLEQKIRFTRIKTINVISDNDKLSAGVGG
jgi:hypothetical protein